MTADSVVQEIHARLISAGYSCGEHFNIGPIEAALYGCKKVRWWQLLPYYLHFYLFFVPTGVQPDTHYVLGINNLARGFTDRFKNRRSRYFRLRVPITVTLVFSDSGFNKEVIAEISTRKQRYQMGDANAVFLLDGSKMQMYRLMRIGFIGILPLHRVHTLVCDLLRNIGFQSGDSTGSIARTI